MPGRIPLTQMVLASALGLLTGSLATGEDDVSQALMGRLQRGELAKAHAELAGSLEAQPGRHRARFALGIVEVLQALEALAQDQYRHGALTQYVRTVPALRLPVPINERPDEITYEQLRQILADFQRRLDTAEATLAKVDVSADVGVRLNLDEVRLDLTGDGTIESGESFMQLFAAVNRPPNRQQPGMQVTFDSGDVPWLRGYCHFLSSFCDVVLAYDQQQVFDVCGHLIYPKAVPSDASLKRLDNSAAEPGTFNERTVLDLIAAIHLMDFPLREPQRMKSAHGHLISMIQLSRESWDLILAETDDDHEWLPNPKQTGVLGIPVTRAVIDGWSGVLAEMEDLLEGRKLVPFWRDYVRFIGPGEPVPETGRGLNLKRFFYEPREFDLVLTIQGTGVLPYLEEGSLSRPQTWRQLAGVFQGQFFGFAIWFN